MASSSYVIGIDLGGTNMQAGVVDQAWKVVGDCKRKTKAEVGLDGVVDRLDEAVRRACEEAKVNLADVDAVGIGVPGAIDIPRGVVIDAPNLRWFDVPIREILTKRFGRPVVVDNDVNVAVWGEVRHGAAKGRSNCLGVWAGTGVGGGLVLDGKLWRGPSFTAGEIGQTIIFPDGGPAKTTLEQHASRTGMVHNIELLLRKYPKSRLIELREENNGRIGSKEIAQAYELGDPAATIVVEHAARFIGIAAANVVTLLSIDTVVVGGGATEAIGEPFIALIRRAFDEVVFPQRLRSCEILLTALEDHAGVIGAAALARDEAAGGGRR
ncbi:MAG TPA: ROK family protein [Phycisphaerales bacterium]|nr:ROK family protein [Phycisphaerales bacterium]HMP35901.1 ROK family protein [Phycisphaerales bacterium]